MNAQVEYDFSVFAEKLSDLTGALIGESGQRGAMQQVVMLEVGQFAGRCGDAMGPKTLAAASKRIDRDVKQYLTAAPRYSVFEDPATQGYSSRSDFTWLTAGPHFLLGINDEDNQLKANPLEAIQMLRVGQKNGSRGNAYEELFKMGPKGVKIVGNIQGQHVYRLNRTRVSLSTFNAVRRALQKTSGELRAAFYRVAAEYTKKRIPQWIASKIEQVKTKGKSRLTESNINTPVGYIEFAVRAPGVESNDHIRVKIQNAARQSEIILSEKLKKVLAGYIYDWSTGRIFRKQDMNN